MQLIFMSLCPSVTSRVAEKNQHIVEKIKAGIIGMIIIAFIE